MIGRLRHLLSERLAPFGLGAAEVLTRDAPGGLQTPGRVSANRHCRLLHTADGWAALNLARPDDYALIPALTYGAGDDWEAVAAYAATTTSAAFVARAAEMHVPVALPGEAEPITLAGAPTGCPLGTVLDLSALWAGPLCAGLLARVGAEVVRVDNSARPDPTPRASPVLDHFLNGAKMRLALDLTAASDRARLHGLVADADIVVTSGRAAALARLGLTPETLAHCTWVAISGHGFTGAKAMRVGFGDDCAIAGGLVSWSDGEPAFFGDALADPLTGVEAARAVLAGETGLIDRPLAGIAAAYAARIS